MHNSHTKPVRPIRKAVFPIAGLGTRFLPATKAMPKEMLTVVDRPLIQHVVDEAREAGIEQFIFVTGRNKGIIEDHFDRQFELETTLQRKGNLQGLEQLERDLPEFGDACFVRQQSPLGLGHAIWCARKIVGDEPFAVLLPDMIMQADTGCLKQMTDFYSASGASNVIAVERAPWEDLHRYGVVEATTKELNVLSVDRMVEKPKKGDVRSNLIISGRYIFQPEIFDILENLRPGSGNEIQLTDAMVRLMEIQAFHAVEYAGTTFDCGDKVGFLAANLAFGLERQDLAPAFKVAMGKIMKAHGVDINWPKQPFSTHLGTRHDDNVHTLLTDKVVPIKQPMSVGAK